MGASPDGLCFATDLSRPEPIPPAGIDRALALMQSGRLHRYGESGGGASEPSQLEEEFAALLGARYCVALSSCGAAMFVALHALGVAPGDKVLTGTFTLAPVPGAIAHAGAVPVLVETTSALKIDLCDLERKAEESGAHVLLLSHMRGHIADLAAVRAVCDARGIAIVEDCAHTLGARWAGRQTGTWGKVGCFSTQSYKHINSGEGGLLVTDDDDVCAQAILASGSYMFYAEHRSRPPAEAFERWRYRTPNFSLRMSCLAAALLRPQLAALPERAALWNAHYRALEAGLAALPRLAVPARDPREEFVASSIQFLLDLDREGAARFIAGCASRGLHIKWFGADSPVGFTSNATHWRYIEGQPAAQGSLALMERLCDMRIPLALSTEDIALICRIVAAALGEA